ncbi:sugar ABC transporter substrate-binding protein [Vagococcus penaei]|uniref:extracellular solute-binding protein n=1 Tax=Vagococcus penaei TaxID=633807 RepID=UPI0010015EA1|nr:extracellular solute-binding protein [Vagococcus penaei]RSU06684.1 sugar ABC transporter substrate-binding protein [Vagococcus penaei]
MKKGMKRLGLGLLTAGVALTLVACGSNKEDKKADSKKSDTLLVSVDKGYTKYIEKVKGDFEKENGIKIELVEKDMFEQLEALSLDGPAGKAPDVMMSAYDRLGPLGQQGHIAELKLSEDSRYDDRDKQQVTVDGKYYGAPAVIETLIMYYNKDLIDKAPTTFKEIEELAKDDKFAFEGEKGKNVGFLAKWTDFYSTYGLLAGYGGYVFGKDGTDPKDVGLATPGAIEGIEYATKWYKDVWPQGMLDIKSTGDFIDTQFIDGKTAVIINGPWAAAGYKDAKVNFGAAKIATLPNGKNYEPFGGGKAWVVSNYAKNKEMGQKFVDYLTNDANQKEFYAMTNEVPANNVAREEAKKGDDEITRAVVEQYESASPMPNIPEMAEVWAGGENLMFDAASGKQTAKEAADAAVKVINENIAQKYGE